MLTPDLLPDGSPATQLSRWADAAAAQIVAAGGPTHVVGASLGASVALRLALDHPALVASLVLDSAQLGGPPPPAALRRLGRLVGAVVGRLPAGLVAAALMTQFPAYQGEDRAVVRADILRLGTPGIIGHLRAQLAHDVRAEAASITAPTLLLAGERDPLTRSGAHRALQAALPQARLVEVPGAGHVTFLSHPEAILRELSSWVSQHLVRFVDL
ncbi:MAG: alpha/beta hydrolase [Chloroflexales bacterium]|nr:alpha/beta hydrolase [Chloroflexales bacterium]